MAEATGLYPILCPNFTHIFRISTTEDTDPFFFPHFGKLIDFYNFLYHVKFEVYKRLGV
jgi:hypothetical protein